MKLVYKENEKGENYLISEDKSFAIFPTIFSGFYGKFFTDNRLVSFDRKNGFKSLEDCKNYIETYFR